MTTRHPQPNTEKKTKHHHTMCSRAFLQADNLVFRRRKDPVGSSSTVREPPRPRPVSVISGRFPSVLSQQSNYNPFSPILLLCLLPCRNLISVFVDPFAARGWEHERERRNAYRGAESLHLGHPRAGYKLSKKNWCSWFSLDDDPPTAGAFPVCVGLEPLLSGKEHMVPPRIFCLCLLFARVLI